MNRRRAIGLAALVALVVGLVYVAADQEQPTPSEGEQTTRRGSVSNASGRFMAGRIDSPSRPLRMSPASVRMAPDETHGAFAGTVVSWASNEPIAGAEITFERGGSTFSTRSRVDGSFFVRPREVGTYALVAVEAEGFHPFAPAWGHSPRSFTAVAETVVEGIVIHLVPKVQYAVKVIDEEGRPVEGAEVSVRSLDDASLVPPTEGTTTDVRGEATLEADDDDVIEARHPEHGVARGVVDFQAQIEKVVRIQFNAHAAQYYTGDGRIEGRVLDASGQPVADALVAGIRGRRHPRASALTDAEGHFVLEGLDRGTYFLRAAARGYAPGYRRRVRVGSTVDIQLGEEGRLRGLVTSADGPVPGFAVAVERRVGTLQSRHAASVAEYDPNGRFEVDGLAAGRYRVTASAPGYASAEAEVEVSAGSTADVGRLELGMAGSVRGIVMSGEEPVSGARVSLEGRLGNADMPTAKTTLTDASGAFSLTGLSPGRTSLVVAAEGHHARIQSGIVVQAGETVELQVDLRALGEEESPTLELAGIGAILGARGDALLVNRVIEGGGAAAAGLQRGDQIVSVDGAAVSTLGFQGAVESIRGPEGSIVRLVVRRGEEDTVFAVTPHDHPDLTATLPPVRIGVMGAGSIGCYVGGRILAANTAEVVLIGRQWLKDELGEHGLTAIRLDDEHRVPPERVRVETSAESLADCDVVLVAVKSAQTEDVARELATILRDDCVVVSLQNGLSNAPTLRQHLGARPVVAAVVGFNVVSNGNGVFHNGMTGPLQLERAHGSEIADVFRASGLETELHADLAPHQWTKLLVNLNNSVSALSGAPTVELLKRPGYRKIVAAIIEEALGVLKAARIKPAPNAQAALAARHLGHRAEKVDDLSPRQVRREAGVFRQVPDAPERGLVADRPTEDRAGGTRGVHHGHHDLDQRALAGPVGPEQAEHLAGVHLHVHATQGVHGPAKFFLDVMEIDCE